MGREEYWVEIRHKDQALGGGVRVTRKHVVTAAHCLGGLASSDTDFQVRLPDGSTVPACFLEARVDLALLELRLPQGARLPVPRLDRASLGDAWYGTYRREGDMPFLDGEVTRLIPRHRLPSGEEIEALQLLVKQLLGDYHGYSGGPIERRGGFRSPAILGVILLQYLDVSDFRRSSNVLFAATAKEAMGGFTSFGAGKPRGNAHWASSSLVSPLFPLRLRP